MKFVQLTVSGVVQGVGYRRAVQRIAQEMGISGYVKNQNDGTVKIIAQSEEAGQLDHFADAIKIDSPPIRIENVEKREIKSSVSYKFFKIVTGSMAEELQDGFGSMEKAVQRLQGGVPRFRRQDRWQFRQAEFEF
jgi:acylphosphatase